MEKRIEPNWVVHPTFIRILLAANKARVNKKKLTMNECQKQVETPYNNFLRLFNRLILRGYVETKRTKVTNSKIIKITKKGIQLLNLENSII